MVPVTSPTLYQDEDVNEGSDSVASGDVDRCFDFDDCSTIYADDDGALLCDAQNKTMAIMERVEEIEDELPQVTETFRLLTENSDDGASNRDATSSLLRLTEEGTRLLTAEANINDATNEGNDDASSSLLLTEGTTNGNTTATDSNLTAAASDDNNAVALVPTPQLKVDTNAEVDPEAPNTPKSLGDRIAEGVQQGMQYLVRETKKVIRGSITDTNGKRRSGRLLAKS